MLHKEGKATILITLIGLFILNFGVSFTGVEWLQNVIIFLSVIFLLIILQFFRNPSVSIDKNENHVISPADGKVVVIEEVDEPEFFNQKDFKFLYL